MKPGWDFVHTLQPVRWLSGLCSTAIRSLCRQSLQTYRNTCIGHCSPENVQRYGAHQSRGLRLEQMQKFPVTGHEPSCNNTEETRGLQEEAERADAIMKG